MSPISPNNFNRKPSPRLLTSIWVLLIILTMLSAYLGELNTKSSSISELSKGLILLILVLKSQLIIDYFMQLKQVKVFWRLTMSIFAICISFIIWSIT
ncbi:cytochrome C oxidase subunit IV family protein [Aliikangiella sp. IMCC44359]|uniref:cytochrome C oxidase subunit IV family protein n=1 Tax=Aliikangiella sp. IMCC44359 TaxID=3459125 RepID=UPI00403AE48D